jgi:hypothetical protein
MLDNLNQNLSNIGFAKYGYAVRREASTEAIGVRGLSREDKPSKK